MNPVKYHVVYDSVMNKEEIHDLCNFHFNSEEVMRKNIKHITDTTFKIEDQKFSDLVIFSAKGNELFQFVFLMSKFEQNN